MQTKTVALYLRLHAALWLCLAVSFFGTALRASAQQPKDPVTVALVAKKVVATDNGETLEPAATTKPGDTVLYQAVYRNHSTGVIRDLIATVPVPEQLALVADSASPAGALASIDGQNFSPMPLMRAVRQADGTSKQQPVPLAEYRALRWSIAQLAAGEGSTVSLRARVVTEVSPK